jgi:putative acetyltransferase
MTRPVTDAKPSTEHVIPRFRALEPEDIDDIVELHRSPGVPELTMRYASEGRRSYRRMFESDDPDRHIIVAEVEHEGRQKVIGLAGVSVFKNPRGRHAAQFFIALHSGWHGRGIGEALSREVLRFADEELGLRRVELHVNVDNAAAIALYEKLGFEREGRLRENVLRRGEYIDSLVMGRLRKV